MSKSVHRYVASILAANGMLTGALLSSPVTAAEGPDTEGIALEEIVVTAQKRSSNLQDTPIAITAFTADQLKTNSVLQIQDLAAVAPGVEMAKNYTSAIITIRGVSSRDTGTISDPAVAVSEDGFYMMKPYGLSELVYDQQRVEVLRGPQGTLYGRDAVGGAINFISNKPSLDGYSGYLGAGYGNYQAITTDGALNAPLNDWSALRVAFSSDRHDGYRTGESAFGVTPGDDADSFGGRLQFLLKPVEALEILLRGQYSHQGGVGPTTEGFALLQHTASGAINTSYEPPMSQAGVPHGIPNQNLDLSIRSFQWNADYNLGFADVIYLGGYRSIDYYQLRNLTGSANIANYFTYDEHVQDHSDELRLVSRGNGPFTWQVGGYWYEEADPQTSDYTSYKVVPPSSPVTAAVWPVTKSNAVYGQVAYELTDGVKLEAGTRRSDDRKDQAGQEEYFGAPVSQYGHYSGSKWTYHVGLNWKVTRETLLYIKGDTGYKAGGFAGTPGTTQHPVQPETVNAIEIGSKSRFWDDHIQLNTAAYYYDYTNQQIGVTVTSGTIAGFADTLNAGKSRNYGFEIEPIVNVTSHDRFDGSIAYLNARFTDFCTSLVNGVCTHSLAGNAPAQAPEVQVIGGYEHVFDLGQATLTARAQAHHESQSFLTPQDFGYSRQAPYTTADAMLTYRSADSKWSAQAYGRNLTNTIIITSSNSNFVTYSYGLAPPRTYGMRFTYDITPQ